MSKIELKAAPGVKPQRKRMTSADLKRAVLADPDKRDVVKAMADRVREKNPE